MNITLIHAILDMLKPLTQDELAFLIQYIQSATSLDAKDQMHKFIDAQVQFIKDELKKI